MLSRRPLVWQLYPTYLLLIVVLLVAVGWYVSDELRDFHYKRTASDLYARTQLVSEHIDGRLDDSYQVWLEERVKRLGEKSQTRITLILADGRVLADSQDTAARMDNHGSRPEVKEAFSGHTGQSVRFSNTVGQTLMYVAVPVYNQPKLLGCVRAALPVSNIEATLSGIYTQLLYGGLMLSVLLAPLCWWLSRRLSKPLEQMTAGAQRFSRGELDRPLVVTGSVETMRLAGTLNHMAVEFAERIEREVEQRNEIEVILGGMIEGIIVIDNDEQVIRLNRAAADLLGVSLHQQKRSIQEVIRQAELQRFVQRALDQQGVVEEELTVYQAQQKRYLHVLATPLIGSGERHLGLLIVLHDLTRLRQLETVRRDFVANVSHELKTPITAIRGSVETLLEECRDEERRFLEIIFKQGERLSALVEDLLELSRIEQGGQDPGAERVEQPLRPLLQASLSACENLQHEQQVDLLLDCDPELVVRVDAHLLEQAVINLMTNAIKYSDSGGRVELTASVKGSELKVSVRDYGCGIAREHLPRLFERFYRVDRARSRRLGGTGLGLAIVKHVAHAHGGEVVVESELGKGSTFTLLLPQA